MDPACTRIQRRRYQALRLDGHERRAETGSSFGGIGGAEDHAFDFGTAEVDAQYCSAMPFPFGYKVSPRSDSSNAEDSMTRIDIQRPVRNLK